MAGDRQAIPGARIWISLAGFSFQPAEIGKICIVIFFAGYLVVQRDNLALAGKKFSDYNYHKFAILRRFYWLGFSASAYLLLKTILVPRCLSLGFSW
ncbi:FtsW/RodA/SpoVE family cell cycle protein [Arcanobacterium hippocoleae]|uniref:FtsW/RodA/SpoVE family cell cycle protein n=1 Tax=Arcanobacterium hippocoleae TaxID=149017 RepID=UPI003341C3EB